MCFVNRFGFIPLVIFVMSQCTFNAAWEEIDKLKGKVDKDEAKSQLLNAVNMKSSTCNSYFQPDFNLAYTKTLTGNACYSVGNEFNEKKEMRTCESAYKFVDKKNLDNCIEEVYILPCDAFRNGVYASMKIPVFPTCVSAFHTDPSLNYL